MVIGFSISISLPVPQIALDIYAGGITLMPMSLQVDCQYAQFVSSLSEHNPLSKQNQMLTSVFICCVIRNTYQHLSTAFAARSKLPSCYRL